MAREELGSSHFPPYIGFQGGDMKRVAFGLARRLVVSVFQLATLSCQFSYFFFVFGAAFCARGSGAETYTAAVGIHRRFQLDLVRCGSSLSFVLDGMGLRLQGTGTAEGSVAQLISSSPSLGTFLATLVFAPDQRSFAGTWTLDSEGQRFAGTLTGQRDPWPTFALGSSMPLLFTSDAVNPWLVAKVSRFRSGEGHDYSDDFESCRSMKHYYLPKDASFTDFALFAPADGVVVGLQESFAPAWKGVDVAMSLVQAPAFEVAIFHIQPVKPLHLGEQVRAGQWLGWSAKREGTATDVAVGVHTPEGFKLFSFFQLMQPRVFAPYRARGVPDPAALVITREERDADPLSCEGQTFSSSGHLPHWVTLTSQPRSPWRRILRARSR